MPLCQVRDATVHTVSEDGAVCVTRSDVDKIVFEHDSELPQLEPRMALQKDTSRTVFAITDGRLDMLLSRLPQFPGYMQFSLHHIFGTNQLNFL